MTVPIGARPRRGGVPLGTVDPDLMSTTGEVAQHVAYPFLSDGWELAARRIRAEYADRVPAVPLSIRANLIVREVPFREGTLAAHLDTSAGGIELELGHLERPDVTITLDYATARGILVGGDPQAVLAAFLGGRIKVDGDISKLLELQGGAMPATGPGTDALATEIYHRIRAITE